MPTPGSLPLAASEPLLAPTPGRLAELEQELRQARAEAALARQHLAALTGNLNEGMILVGADYQVVLINDQVCQVFSLPLPASQWVSQPLAKMMAQARACMADPAAYDAETTQALTCGVGKQLLRLADGRLLERDVRAVRLGDEAGWLLSYRDLTAQHQALTQRDAQRTFYETLLDEVPVEIVVLDEQRRYLYANPQAVPDPAHRAWLLGRTIDEYCARYAFPMALAEQRNRMFEQVEASTEPVFWDDCTPTVDGPIYHQRHFTLLSGAAPGLPYMLGCGLNVTARVRAEERSQRSELARREQQEFMRHILNTGPNPVYVRDAAGALVFGNQAQLELEEAAAQPPASEALRQSKKCEATKQAAVNAQVLATHEEVRAEEACTLTTGERRLVL